MCLGTLGSCEIPCVSEDVLHNQSPIISSKYFSGMNKLLKYSKYWFLQQVCRSPNPTSMSCKNIEISENFFSVYLKTQYNWLWFYVIGLLHWHCVQNSNMHLNLHKLFDVHLCVLRHVSLLWINVNTLR